MSDAMVHGPKLCRAVDQRWRRLWATERRRGCLSGERFLAFQRGERHRGGRADKAGGVRGRRRTSAHQASGAAAVERGCEGR